MPKICIFNTQETKDSAFEPFDPIIPVTPDSTVTEAVRLPVKALNAVDCAFEFIFSSSSAKEPAPAPEGGLQLTLHWWREFWGDDVPGALQNPPPDKRVLYAVNPNTPWSRESGHVENPAGQVVNQPLTRTSTLFIPEGEFGATLWVRTKVYAPWIRLGISLDTPATLGHLLINMHVGGHSEVKSLDANGQYPYVYKFKFPA